MRALSDLPTFRATRGFPFWKAVRAALTNLGPGGVELLYPDTCEMIAETRVKELALTGANKIVSCCPVCAVMIKRGIKKAGLNLEYVDIADLFYNAAKRSAPRLAAVPHAIK